jgi:flagellin-like hook-associated protein FlgL
MGQKSRIASHVSIAEGISRARGIIDVTLASGSAIADILKQMKTAAGAARSEDLTADQRLALQADYEGLRSQIDRIAASAQFNGANLAGAGGSDLDFILSDRGAAGSVQRIRSSNSTPVAGTTLLVSRDAAGSLIADGVGTTGADLGADNRFVVFSSVDPNIVAGDTNSASDIFLRDLQSGRVTLVSTDAAGGLSNGVSREPVLSPDGRFVLFSSSASNLVAGDTNGQGDIFLKDLQTGDVTRVSTDASGAQATGGPSLMGRFSADGEYVIFQSGATNLVAGDTNGGRDIFLKNIASGAITRVSTSAAGTQATGGDSTNPRLSADGRYVTFSSAATDLVSGDTNGVSETVRSSVYD